LNEKVAKMLSEGWQLYMGPAISQCLGHDQSVDFTIVQALVMYDR
jgi:hypothetical protein